MADATLAVTAGSGTLLHTNTRVISSNTNHEEFLLPGEYPVATYSVVVSSVATATANSHMLQIMAGSSLNVRVRSIRIIQYTAPAAVTRQVWEVWRLSTAGTGGTALTPRPHDTAASASGATAMTLPTVKGTESVLIDTIGMHLGTAAIPTPDAPEVLYPLNVSPIIIAAGTTNGIALKNIVGLATATCSFVVKIVETSFV